MVKLVCAEDRRKDEGWSPALRVWFGCRTGSISTSWGRPVYSSTSGNVVDKLLMRMAGLTMDIDNPFWKEVEPFVKPGRFGSGGSPFPRSRVVQRYPSSPDLPNWRDLMHRYSWSIPDPIALEQLVALDLGPIVEIGAGTGYWANLLTQLNVDIVCYDAHPPARGPNNWHKFGDQWTPINAAGVEAAAAHPSRALLLSWPPHNDPMATTALSLYQGDTVIYMGDRYYSGDDAFYDLLDTQWTLAHSIDPVRWEGQRDTLDVFTRTTAVD